MLEPDTSDRGADLISTSTPSLPPDDEVHTFPGICDDHPLDDLSSIAIAPLTYDGTLQSCSEQTRADNILPPPEAGSLPHHVVAGHQLEVFPTDSSFPAAATQLEQQKTKLLLQEAGLFQPDVSSHMHSVCATGEGQQMLLKQEVPSPTDLATPGTSGCGSSAAQAGAGSTLTALPSSPVIPLTALELISRDSDSSGSDAAQASSSSGKAAGRSSTSGGTLDRRKGSDDADSSDDTIDEVCIA